MATAILVDGGFFIRRYRALRGKQTAAKVAEDLHRMCLDHLRQRNGRRELYRIFFYDCPPLAKKAHHPVTGKLIDFSTTGAAVWRAELHRRLRSLRKVALRLGYLNDRTGCWRIHPEKLKSLLAGRIAVRDLTEADVYYDVRQKGVDMRIGLDIASMAFKRQVDQIILVAGDSDFVPAAKLARREGIDFILDPMWASIREDLHEHVDGLRSVIQRCPGDSPDAAASQSAV
ncbi:MAG: NYN domain-containing protein [Verrucomicrobia bacterium]|nr:MAG: NYN domain-containing protein [Verrucomicrobiota bacterium]